MSAIPKTVWILWLQGWDEAPEIVRACVASWLRWNPGWRIHLLTREHVDQLLSRQSTFAKLAGPDMPPEALSDAVRLELLARFGGVWADATTYCLIPLDRWLPKAAVTGFFAFNRPGRDRMLASWFLAAEPASPIIACRRALAQEYWARRRERDAYFWVHYLFADAYRTDTQVKAIWDTTPKYSANLPHAFIPYRTTLFAPPSPEMGRFVETGGTPLLKLTHKLAGEPGEGTTYRWLCDRELKSDVVTRCQAWEGSLAVIS